MRLSIWPLAHQPWADVLDAARHADASGWDGVYIADHFMGDGGSWGPVNLPMLESTALLAALASATERVRLGSLVFGITYRHPAVLANWAATVDHVSGGRFVLGVGAGWQQNEHEQYGIRLGPPAERVGRFGEALPIIAGLLRQEQTTVVGEHYRVTEAFCEPKPVQDPLPLLVGAKGDHMLGLAGRWADEWNMWGLPGAIAERAAVLDRACETAGRDPAAVVRSAQAMVLVTDDPEEARRFEERVAPRAAVAGPPERFAEVVHGWAEVGVGEVVVPDLALGTGARRRDAMDALREVVPPG